MKIAVCMKQVPATSQGDMDKKTGVMIRSGLQAIVNVYDLAALEAASHKRAVWRSDTCIYDGTGQGGDGAARGLCNGSR